MWRGESGVIAAARQHAVNESLIQQQLASTLERVTDGVVSFDWALNFTYVNAAAARISGRRPKDLTEHN